MNDQNDQPKVSENHLTSLGALLLDMCIKPGMNFDNDLIDFVQSEFERVEACVTATWACKPAGLDYFIMFHTIEAFRLYHVTMDEEKRTTERKEPKKRAACRAAIYQAMQETLALLITLLNDLNDGDNIERKHTP